MYDVDVMEEPLEPGDEAGVAGSRVAFPETHERMHLVGFALDRLRHRMQPRTVRVGGVTLT